MVPRIRPQRYTLFVNWQLLLSRKNKLMQKLPNVGPRLGVAAMRQVK